MPSEHIKIVIIDNYDSFTFNLRHLLLEVGAEVDVMPNDGFDLPCLEKFDKIVLGPGPGVPAEAGLTLDVIRAYNGVKPILGVCLGHQAICGFFGAKLVNLGEVYHGVATCGVQYGNDPLFRHCPRHFEMGRYHSWVVSKEDFPDCMEITAESNDGLVMAARHKVFDTRGIQFHPESILTPCGKTMIEDWLNS